MNPRNQFFLKHGTSSKTLHDAHADEETSQTRAPSNSQSVTTPHAHATNLAFERQNSTGDTTKAVAHQVTSYTPGDKIFSLKLFVMSASDLGKFDLVGSSDPFCVVSLLDDTNKIVKEYSKTTKVVKNNLNPEWKEVFLFENIPNHANYKLEFAIYDWDRTSKAEFMGHVIVSADQIKKIGRKDEPELSLRCKLASRVLPSGVGTEPEEHRLKGNIFVIIGCPDTDLTKLPPIYFNPTLVNAPGELEQGPIDSHGHGHYNHGSLGRKSLGHHGTLGRHHGHGTAGALHGRGSAMTLKKEEKGEGKDDHHKPDEDDKRSEKDEIETPEKKVKREKLKDEVLATEKSYVESLKVLIENFVQPLREQKDIIGVDDQQLAHLFGNLEQIHVFHQTFLKELEAKKDNPAAAIAKYGDYFKMYTAYMNGYERCLNEINNLRNNKKFQEFLAKMRAKFQKIGGLDLMSYMIMPVQRVPRYVLLLRELRKQSPSTLPDFQALGDALHKIKDIARHINDAKRQVENMSKLIEIQNRISGSMGTTLIAPHRRLIREGNLQTIENKGLFGSIHQSVRLFYLFSDILLWTSQDHKFKGVMNLAAAKLSESDKTRTGFEITTSTKNLVMHCKDEAEKKDWTHDLDEAIASLQASREHARQIKQDVMVKKRKAEAHGERMTAHNMITNRLSSLSVHGSESAVTHDYDVSALDGAHSRKGSLDKSEPHTPTGHTRNDSAGIDSKSPVDISMLGASPPATPGHGHHSHSAPSSPQPASSDKSPEAIFIPAEESKIQQTVTLRGVDLPATAVGAANRSTFQPRQIASRGARREQLTLTKDQSDAAAHGNGKR